MADIKTITEELEVSGKEKENQYLKNDEIDEVLTVKLLKAKIDELVVEVNKIKDSL
tara:strand:- start:433 stop:600 length:168 start_codon:yes stop_codon:yes gene_type:complete